MKKPEKLFMFRNTNLKKDFLKVYIYSWRESIDLHLMVLTQEPEEFISDGWYKVRRFENKYLLHRAIGLRKDTFENIINIISKENLLK